MCAYVITTTDIIQPSEEGVHAPYYVMRTGAEMRCIKAVKISDQNYLLGGTVDGNIILISMDTKRSVWNQAVSENSVVLHIDIFHEGVALTYSKDHTFSILHYTEDSAIIIATLKLEQYTYCRFTITPLLSSAGHSEKCLLAIPSNTSREQTEISIFTLDSNSWSLDNEIKLKGDMNDVDLCIAIKFSRDSTKLFVVGIFMNGFVAIWDYTSQSIIYKIKLAIDAIFGVDFDEIKKMGVVGGIDGYLGVFRVKKNEKGIENFVTDSITVGSGKITQIKIRNDRKLFACSGEAGSVCVYSWKSFTLLSILKFHDTTINDIEYSVDNGRNTIILCDKTGIISLWCLY